MSTFLDLVRSKYDMPEDFESDGAIQITVNKKFQLNQL
jgi:hypothetical protein